MMKRIAALASVFFVLGLFVSFAGVAHAAGKTMDVEIFTLTTENATGLGKSLGKVTLVETPDGLVIRPMIKGLPPGSHGFHVHVNPDLGPVEKDGKLVAGLKAGGHYDPKNTGKHLGPYDDMGHLGDLPVLFVAKDGSTPVAVLAPRIKSLDMIMNRSLMIHVHGDNYSDTPKALGGGGPRLAGGIIK